MKAKPMAKTETAWGMVSGSPNDLIFTRKRNSLSTVKCRIEDARRPSAMRAVELILQGLHKDRAWHPLAMPDAIAAAEAMGMTAKITNGKIKCEWRDK